MPGGSLQRSTHDSQAFEASCQCFQKTGQGFYRAAIGVLLGLYWGYIGGILGFFKGSIGAYIGGRLGLYIRGILGLYRGYTGMDQEVADSLRLAHLTDSWVYLCIPSPHLCLRRPIVTCCARQLKPLVGSRFVAPALSAGSSATKSSKFSIRRALEMRTRTHGNALRRLVRRR